MSPLTQQYIDLCARYSTKPNADVAIWSSFVDAPPAGLEEVPPPPPPPPQPLEESRVWKGILDRQALCNCSRLPACLQKRHHDAHWLTGLHGAGATLVVRPNIGERLEYFTDLDMLALCDLLADVEVLQSLDLSRCRLGPSGVILLCSRVLASPRLSSASMSLIVGGGVLYTLGVPFFVRNKQTLGVPDHTIWHVFVLLGALAHYLFIYWHVVPFAGYLGTQVQVPTDLRRLHAPML